MKGGGLLRKALGTEKDGPFRPDAVPAAFPLVKALGGEAMDRFLIGLEPHLDAVQHGEKDAAEQLASYLSDTAVNALIAKDMGGLAAFDAAFETPPSTAAPASAQQVVDSFEQIQTPEAST